MHYNDGDLQKLIYLGLDEFKQGSKIPPEQKETLQKERAAILKRLGDDLLPQAHSGLYLELIKGYQREMNGQHPLLPLQDYTGSLFEPRWEVFMSIVLSPDLQDYTGSLFEPRYRMIDTRALLRENPDIILENLKAESADEKYKRVKKTYEAAIAQHLGMLVAHTAPIEEKNLPAIIWREAMRGRGMTRLVSIDGWTEMLPSTAGMGYLAGYSPEEAFYKDVYDENLLGFVVKITVELVKALNALNIDLLDFSKCGQYLFMLTNQTVSRLKIQGLDGEQVDTIGKQIWASQQMAQDMLVTIIGKAKIEKQSREKLPDRQIASEAAQILKDPPRGPGDDQAPDGPDPAFAG